jgi:hypothetical protein
VFKNCLNPLKYTSRIYKHLTKYYLILCLQSKFTICSTQSLLEMAKNNYLNTRWNSDGHCKLQTGGPGRGTHWFPQSGSVHRIQMTQKYKEREAVWSLSSSPIYLDIFYSVTFQKEKAKNKCKSLWNWCFHRTFILKLKSTFPKKKKTPEVLTWKSISDQINSW